MTKYECAVIMAYTGTNMLVGDDLKYFYEYVAQLFGRPVYTHEMASLPIKEKSRPDFIRICSDAVENVSLSAVYSRPKSEKYACTGCGEFCYYPHSKTEIPYRFCPNCGKEVQKNATD